MSEVKVRIKGEQWKPASPIIPDIETLAKSKKIKKPRARRNIAKKAMNSVLDNVNHIGRSCIGVIGGLGGVIYHTANLVTFDLLKFRKRRK